MKVLCIIPPQIPSYFNAGHHLPVFQIGAYIRKFSGVEHVSCIDAAALNYTWKEICTLLLHKFDLIVLMNDFDSIDTFERFIHYSKTLVPSAKLLTVGRLSKQIPEFFENYGFDGIVSSGDYEAGVGHYIKYLMNSTAHVPGVYLKTESGYSTPEHGIFLNPEEWVLPDVNEIPYEAYDKMYMNDLNKFCGIPKRRELVVPVARGCPINCQYCDVPSMQGRRERRLPVRRVLDYIEQAFCVHPFEYVSFYAPTFTLNKEWVEELCNALIAKKSLYPWKCVTTLSHLNESLLELMSASGCVRLSVGLETLDPGAFSFLPKVKQDTQALFEKIADLCSKCGIELNCFVILGLPGDTVEGAKYTIQQVLSKGARVRPTIYTPYHLMKPEMDKATIASFNRQLFVDGIHDPEVAGEYYRLFFNNEEDRVTRVMEKIPLKTE